MRILRKWPLAKALHIQHVSYTTFLETLPLRQSPRLPLVSSHQCRHAHAISWPSEESTSPLTHSLSPSTWGEQRNLLTPSLSDIDKPAAWIRLLEPYLPVELRTSGAAGLELTTTAPLSPIAIAQIVTYAGLNLKKSILVHLGLEEQRWEAVLWIVRVLVETSSRPQSTSADDRPLSNMNWPPTRPLQDLTTRTFTLDYQAIDTSPSQRPLTNFTTNKESALKTASLKRGKSAVGQIWQTLGNLIFAASEKNAKSNKAIMSYVLRIVADLHHNGWVPHDVYSYQPSGDPSSLQQPPLLHAFSSRILSALSDTVYESQLAEGTLHGDRFTAQTKTSRRLREARASEMGTEIWMEFVLWCCVRGSWLREGTSIVEILRKSRRRQNLWSMVDWRDVPQKAAAEVYPSGFHRTISTEVVVALIDGLVLSLTRTMDQPIDNSIGFAIDAIQRLKAFLDLHKMNPGVFTWDALITRLGEVPAFEVENNPRLMETILELADVYGVLIKSVNVSSSSDDSNQLPVYIYEPSAAVIGLYHRTLHAYIKSRDLDRALKILWRLQSLTDKHKTVSLKEFLEELKATSTPLFRKVDQDDAEHGFDFRSFFPGIHYPGFHPNIPVHILADLLDMITDAGVVDIGRWMIHSTDVDGPLIPWSLYGNQQIAPALIRFAATTSDTVLLSKLARTQTAAVSARTLVALCQGRIREASWDGATQILGLIRDHSLHTWTAEDFSLLLRPLIVHNLIATQTRSREAPSPPAALLLQKLLRGDLGQVWGPEFSQCDSIAGVLSSISPLMAGICSGMLVIGREYTLDMSTVTFDLLLRGTTDALGSSAGRHLWEKWCSGTKDQREVELPKTSTSRDVFHRLSPSEAFFGQETEDDPVAESRTALFTGYLTKRIESMRIIIQRALQEARTSVPGALPGDTATVSETLKTAEPLPRHEVLDWAARVLRTDFDLSTIDIDYELEGYLSSQQGLSLPAKRYYSAQTLSIWKVFTGSRRQWVRAHEQRLRSFVESPAEKQIVFEYVPPAERYFLHCLAADFGLVSESFGEEMERATKVSKTPKTPDLPTRTVEEVVRRG